MTMSALEEMKSKWVKGAPATDLELLLIMNWKAPSAEAAAAELTRLQAIEEAAKRVIYLSDHVHKAVDWADAIRSLRDALGRKA